MSKFIHDLAESRTYRLDTETDFVIGQEDSYTFFIEELERNATVIHISVKQKNQENNNESFAPLLEDKAIQSILTSGNRVKISVKDSLTKNKGKEKLVHVLDLLLSYLKEQNFENICENSSIVGPTDVYSIGGKFYLLSQQGFETLSQNQEHENQAYSRQKENVITGFVGALLGSIIGLIAILIVAQLGYVSVWTGLVMGVCTIKGYEMLGRKLSTKGIIISSILVLGMTYLANQLDWAISLVRELGGDYLNDLPYALQLLPEMLSQNLIDSSSYWINLALLFLFSGVGAIAMIISSLKAHKNKFETRKL